MGGSTPTDKERRDMYGPTIPLSREIHAEKYRQKGESFDEAMTRVASALQDDTDHFYATRDILLNMRFMPGGRIQAAMGTTKSTTPYNCYVSGTINDSFVDGDGNIMQRAQEAAATMRMGGGIGYDFSTLRPSGDMIRKLQSPSSGPISFMHIYDAVCKCVSSAGHRRGAQMGVMRIDHPDVENFIRAKHDQTTLTGFNISVAVTDEFMECLRDNRPFTQKFNGRDYGTVDSHALWEMLMRSTWDWAEPGILFIDTINNMNNLKYCETIAATNPCGEQPLPPFGACLLGSFNMTRYLYKDGRRWLFNWDQLHADIPPIVRMMDNVVDRARYPLSEQYDEALDKRRMGLGVTGMANCLEAQGLPYGSDGYVEAQDQILKTITNNCYKASAKLAEEKGAFPLYTHEYMDSNFVNVLDSDVQSMIDKHGIRNSHLTSIAPTGTISLAADNISSGIEPVFAESYTRTIKGGGTSVREELVYDYGVGILGVKPKVTADVSVAEHLAVLASAQTWTDSAVSKTCNVPADTPWQDFKNLYVQAWERGCKGCTTFQTGGKRAGILVEAPEEETEGAACYIDPNTGRKECG